MVCRIYAGSNLHHSLHKSGSAESNAGQQRSSRLGVRRQFCQAVIERLENRVLLSSTPAVSVPLNQAITSNPAVQYNPSIAADPLNPEHLVVSYMDQSLVNTGYEGIGVAVSENGGTTWQTTSVEALGACIALRPDAPWGYSARGMTLGLLRRFDEARRDLDVAIKLNPDFRPAWLNRGVVDWLQNDRDSAMADLAQALKPPDELALEEALYYRAQIHLASGDSAGAMSDLNSLLSRRTDFYPAYQLRARLYLLQGSEALAVGDLNAELKQLGQPGPSPKGLSRRGELLRQAAAQLPGPAARKALQLACGDFAAAIQAGGQSADALRDLGAAREALGQLDAAAQAYSAAIRLAPSDLQAILHRGWLNQKLGQYDQSAADFMCAIEVDSTNAEAYCGLGYVHACRKSSDDARDCAAQALLFGGNDYLILHNVACIYAELSNFDAPRQHSDENTAMAMLQRAIEIWHRTKGGPDEVNLIKQEPAFPPSLRALPQFARLLAQDEQKR